MTDLSLLDKNYPGLLADLENHDEDELPQNEISIEKNAANLPVLKIRGIYIHSPRDPVREAGKQVEQITDSGTDRENPVIILGFGLGYITDAPAFRDLIAGNRPVIVVERRREVLRLALEHRDLGPFLMNNRVIFAPGGKGERLPGALSLLKKNEGRPIIIRNRALMNLDHEWYAEAENAIHTWSSRNEINRATLKRFGRRWVRNLSQNLTVIRDRPGISGLRDMLKNTGIPVFLAAAGPTLDSIRQAIPEIAKRCVVIAVDTSLRFILGTGVQPDFVVSLDPQFWNYRHLDRTIAPETSLIAESAVYPPCLRHPFKNVFLCGSLFPLGRFIEERVDPKGEIGAGGSVATAAWDFARTLGTKTVWLAGLDLSFPNLKTHFRGAVFEEKSHSQSYRFIPGETWSVKALRDGGPFRAKNSAGGAVLTDQRLSLYAAWFENRFGMFNEIQNFILSGEGLAIKGLEIGKTEDLLALPQRRDEINSLKKKVFSEANEEFSPGIASQKRAERYEEAKKTLLSGLKDIKNTAEEAGKLAAAGIQNLRNNNFNAEDEKKLLKKLDNANKAITASSVKETAGFLFPDPDELEKTIPQNQNPLQRHLEYSASFYKALAEAAGYNLRFLGDKGEVRSEKGEGSRVAQK